MTDTAQTSLEDTVDPTAMHDVLRRHLKRQLPVRLTRDEQTDIAIAAAKKRQVVRQLETDLVDEKKRRQAQIDEHQREIDTADRELATGEQDRSILCNEIFRDGLVLTVRTDTWRVVERRPATAAEANRFLPGVEEYKPGGVKPLFDDAAPRTNGAALEAPDGSDEVDEIDEDDGPEDDGLQELTPAQSAAKEAATARKARRGSGGKKGKAK